MYPLGCAAQDVQVLRLQKGDFWESISVAVLEVLFGFHHGQEQERHHKSNSRRPGSMLRHSTPQKGIIIR